CRGRRRRDLRTRPARRRPPTGARATTQDRAAAFPCNHRSAARISVAPVPAEAPLQPHRTADTRLLLPGAGALVGRQARRTTLRSPTQRGTRRPCKVRSTTPPVTTR